MKALILNCTLKPGPETSNTEVLAGVVADALRGHGVEVSTRRLVELDIRPGVESDMGDGDQWPAVHDELLASDILVVATPTWVGKPSSVAQRMLERMDAMISETDDDARPVAYNRVAGVVVTGNEDGAHHVISELAGGLIDIGYTVPGPAWTYWNMGPRSGPVVHRNRPRSRLVGEDRPHHGRQPGRCRHRPDSSPGAGTTALTRVVLGPGRGQ